MKLLILTPIAERDIHFYLAAADRLRRDSELKIIFFSFYQPGNQTLKDGGYEVCDPYEALKSLSGAGPTAKEIESHYKTLPLPHLVQHEKLTFGLKSDEEAIFKFRRLVAASEILLQGIETRYPAQQKWIVQELAGFLGPLSLFYVGMARGWKNEFLEPSFFKGRVHFVSNDLFLKIKTEKKPSPDSLKFVETYLEEALKNKVVVAATKDAHHYKDMGFAKVFNLSNFQKISKKLFYKYVKGEKQEFEHIWNHSFRYLKMLKNRLENQKKYSQISDLPKEKNIFYFPFHVQLDFALTIRCPEWLDQLALIEKVIPLLPEDSLLISKEHPASIGCLDQDRLEKLFANPKFRLMHPQINSHDLLDLSSGVVTINSKVGAEAVSKGLPAIAFGKAFYSDAGVLEKFKTWEQVRELLASWKNSKARSVKPEWKEFLATVYEQSFANELYDLSTTNVESFAAAVKERIRS